MTGLASKIKTQDWAAHRQRIGKKVPGISLMLARAGRLYRTLRPLRAVQLYGRVVFRVARPKPDIAQPPLRGAVPGSLLPVAGRKPSLIAPGVFETLNARCDVAQSGWDDPALPKLLRYNLHYFDDLNAEGSAARRDWHRSIVTRWIAENPPASGSGWEPYPTSLRMVNWIKWDLCGNNMLDDAAVASLAVQARWLTRRLEWHLLGNHLFTNAKALVFAGLFFEGEEARKWLEQGMAILAREVPEQILPDGGQFELSPMYHALAVEDMLDLANIAQCFDARLSPAHSALFYAWRARIPVMLHWLRALSHSDGRIGFFNDAAFGIAPENAALLAYGAHLGLQESDPIAALCCLRSSGYARLQNGAAVVLADIAPVGPTYLPAHAHADTLSFEMSLHGVRLIVNAGSSVYGDDAERHRQRGTAAHSTLGLNGENSSEVWGGFRVGRRARVSEVTCESTPDALRLAAQHDGYTHMPGRPVHHRTWELQDDRLIVIDTVRGGGTHSADIRYHLAPGITARADAPGGLDLITADGQALGALNVSGPGQLHIEAGSWHPEFGRSEDNICLRLHLSGNAPFSVETVIVWSNP
jgi:uncharacterized heparinase superfamily protein